MTDRNRQLAQIHIARAQLGMDEECYRAMLWTIGRVQSAAKLDHAGRAAVLDHLKARGFKPAAPRSAGKPRSPAPDKAAMIGKIGALLAEAKRPWLYAERIAQRMFRVERLEWCDAAQLRKVIASLEYDAKRNGRRTA